MLEYHTSQERDVCLRYELGCRIGALSGELIPLSDQERTRIEAEHHQAVAEYYAERAAQPEPIYLR